MSSRIIRTLFLVSMVVALASGANGPRGADHKRVDALHRRTDEKTPDQRDCVLYEDDDEIEFECKTKTENEADDTEIEDEIKFKVRVDAGLKIKVEYEQEIETDSTETETETQYEISYDRLVEYVKSDPASSGNQAYDWESDNVVQEIELMNWQDFSSVQDDDEGITSTFSISSVNNTVTFTFTITRADQNATLTANSMKIDFRLTNFPWTRSDSYVALISTVESQRTIEIDDGEDGDTVEDVKISFSDVVDTVGFVPFGEYTWATTAEAMNTTSGASANIQVVATSPQSSGANVDVIAFSFVGDGAQGSDIYWDPEAGIAYESSSSRLGIAVGVAIVFVGLFL